MKKLERHFNNATDHIRMTAAEKDAMRENLMHMMDVQTTPLRQGSAGLKSPYQWLWAPRSFVTLGLAALVIASSGTAYAAEGSLPGAPLYGVKINVIEPIRVALAATPAQKAEVHADIATTRVEEAQTLAAKGDLTPQTAKEISDNYNEHAIAALALAADVGSSALATSSATQAVSVARPQAASETLPQETPGQSTTTAKKPAQNFSIGSHEPRESFATASATSSAAQTSTTTPGPADDSASATTQERGDEQQSDLFGTLHARFILQTDILNHIDEQVRSRHHRDSEDR